MTTGQRESDPWWAPVRRHPVITSVLVGAALLGAIVGLAVLDTDWSLARRAAAGAVAGGGIGFLMTATKLFD
jgi:hypothetical protein